MVTVQCHCTTSEAALAQEVTGSVRQDAFGLSVQDVSLLGKKGAEGYPGKGNRLCKGTASRKWGELRKSEHFLGRLGCSVG